MRHSRLLQRVMALTLPFGIITMAALSIIGGEMTPRQALFAFAIIFGFTWNLLAVEYAIRHGWPLPGSFRRTRLDKLSEEIDSEPIDA